MTVSEWVEYGRVFIGVRIPLLGVWEKKN